ncbi:MAG: NADH-quinone oxidoreductase subunit C [Verrucomicrobiota bacterium]
MSTNEPQPKFESAPLASPPAAPAPTAAVPPKPVAATAPRPAAPAQPPPPPAPPAPNPLAHLPLPFKGVDYAAKGYHADATVSPDLVVAVAEVLDKEGLSLDTITGVDWMAEGQMEVVYDYFHPAKALRVVVRTRIPRDNPEIASIHKVFPGANWHERETHDFFGIRFLGHPNLTPFLLPEDADFHPLRKDFAP